MVIACTRDCYDTCVFDDQYNPIKEEPTAGFTCSRGRTDLRRNEVNRITGAYIDGREVPLTEAIARLAKKIREVEPKQILHVEYDGNQGLLTWYYPARLWNVLGAVSTDYSICSLEGHEGIKAHYGSSMGALPEEMKSFRSVAFWGSEAVFSFIHGWKIFKDIYKIVVDVRMSETAKRSERAYIIKPGSDAHLAIALMKIFIEEGYAKPGLVDLEKLKLKLDLFDMNQLLKDVGLSEEEVKELADLYAYYQPLTVIGFALGRSWNGGFSAGLVSMLPAVLGIKHGFFYSNSYGWGIDFAYLRGTHMFKPETIGMGEIGENIERFKILFVWNSNPVVTLPGGNAIKEAVEEGRLTLVTHDPFWSDTAKLSNIVFPAPTFLEKEDVVYSYWHPYLVYNRPVRPAKGITEVELMKRVAKELNLDHPLINEDPWIAVDRALRKTGVTVEELRSKGMVRISPLRGTGRAEVDPFPTPKDLDLPRGEVIVFSAHPNYTNSQFTEIYGRKDAVIYSRKYEGEGVLESRGGRIRVKFVKDDLPEGVLFTYKSNLVAGNTTLNSVLRPPRNRFGGPRLNDEVKVILDP